MIVKNRTLSPCTMARRSRRARNYKTMDVFTKDFGDAGAQLLIGSWSSIDPGTMTGYLNNVNVTGILNGGTEADPDQGGMMFYLSTNNSWADVDVFSANAYAFGGGKCSLSAKRKVSGELFDDMVGGKVYLYGEVSDVTLTQNVSLRLAIESWGRFLKFTPNY